MFFEFFPAGIDVALIFIKVNLVRIAVDCYFGMSVDFFVDVVLFHPQFHLIFFSVVGFDTFVKGKC